MKETYKNLYEVLKISCPFCGTNPKYQLQSKSNLFEIKLDNTGVLIRMPVDDFSTLEEWLDSLTFLKIFKEVKVYAFMGTSQKITCKDSFSFSSSEFIIDYNAFNNPIQISKYSFSFIEENSVFTLNQNLLTNESTVTLYNSMNLNSYFGNPSFDKCQEITTKLIDLPSTREELLVKIQKYITFS